MFIVKEGNLGRLVEEKTFECTACGCVFVANNTEYTKQIDYRNNTFAECECPCCKRLVIWYPGGK